MAETELKSITLNIAGKNVPLSVHYSEVEMMKEAEKDINERISKYQIDYRLKDKMDGAVMLLLTYAVDNIKANNLKSNSEIDALLGDIEEIVSP